MTLLRQIQEGAADSSTYLPDLLRKTKTLARRLESAELEQWVDHELSGYGDNPLPPYRVLKTHSLARFPGYRIKGTMRFPTSLLPENLRERATTVQMAKGIAYLEQLLASPPSGGGWKSNWPDTMLAWVQANIPLYDDPDIVPDDAWCVVTPQDIAGIRDAIRTRLLDLALDLEEEHPDAGETAPGEPSPIAPERVTQIINNAIFSGGNQTVSIGNNSASQTMITVPPGDRDALLSALRLLGVSEDHFPALDQALERDAEAADGQLGSSTRQWIDRMSLELGTGAAQWAGGMAAGTIFKALADPIMAFLGIR